MIPPARATGIASPLTVGLPPGAPGSLTGGTFPQPTPNTSRNYTTAPPTPTGSGNDFVSVAVLADSTGCATSRLRRMNATADQSTYDGGRLTSVGTGTCNTASQLGDQTFRSAHAVELAYAAGVTPAIAHSCRSASIGFIREASGPQDSRCWNSPTES